MQDNNLTLERISQLRKTISTLKWDLSMISNDMLKPVKERQLLEYSKELENLTRSCSAS